MINKDIFKIFILTLIITNSLIIGFLPGLLYFYFLPIISLIILITILWFTNYNSLKKIAFSILPIIIVPICILIWKKINTVEPEIFLIPKNYRGFVYISYNHKCGTPIKYEEDSRVYEIPNDGVLLTQFKDEQGFIKLEGKNQSTNKEGVFAAGDVCDPHYQQAIIAAGSGASAALDAHDYLNEIGK